MIDTDAGGDCVVVAEDTISIGQLPCRARAQRMCPIAVDLTQRLAVGQIKRVADIRCGYAGTRDWIGAITGRIRAARAQTGAGVAIKIIADVAVVVYCRILAEIGICR